MKSVLLAAKSCCSKKHASNPLSFHFGLNKNHEKSTQVKVDAMCKYLDSFEKIWINVWWEFHAFNEYLIEVYRQIAMVFFCMELVFEQKFSLSWLQLVECYELYREKCIFVFSSLILIVIYDILMMIVVRLTFAESEMAQKKISVNSLLTSENCHLVKEVELWSKNW